jgi:hypothetical protein
MIIIHGAMDPDAALVSRLLAHPLDPPSPGIGSRRTPR